MAFISSKFNQPSKAGSGLNAQDWADLYLDKLATAFTTANAAWSVYSAKETIGTNTNTNYGCRTIQLKSSVSEKYVRIWCFGNEASTDFVDTPTTSGGYNNLHLYRGNIMKIGSNQCLLNDDHAHSEIYFGVSDNPIDADFAKDLGLSVGMFGLINRVQSTTSGMNMAYRYGDQYTAYYYGAIISVITDGKFFGVMRQMPDNASRSVACFYAPDMMICANSDDHETEGVISSIAHNEGSFYFGNNNPYDGQSYVAAIFNAADGTRDFRGWTEGNYNGKEGCMASEDSTGMPCTALKIFLNIQTYSGSTLDGIKDGASLKGWINPEYMRSANVVVLPETCKSLTYGNGAWLCTNAGTLICWDASNSSPFEAAN